MQRATLLVNHIIAAEPVAAERLRRHPGASIAVEFNGWPTLMPSPPRVVLLITPAGLLEWLGGEPSTAADLHILVEASNPLLVFARMVTGTRPQVSVSGDAVLAGDVDWLIDNLRWDVQDDLARLVGNPAADQLARLARGIADGLRGAVRTVGGVVGRGAAEPSRQPKPR